MAYKHDHCVIPTVARLKPRETLPEPEWSPLGGTTLFFFHCLDSMFPLVESAGSNQETEIHEKLTSSFYRSNNEMSCRSKGGHPSHRFFLWLCFERGQVAGGSSVQMHALENQCWESEGDAEVTALCLRVGGFMHFCHKTEV